MAGLLGRLAWVGGKDTPKTDEQSARRARAHHRHARDADRAGWAWADKQR